MLASDPLQMVRLLHQHMLQQRLAATRNYTGLHQEK